MKRIIIKEATKGMIITWVSLVLILIGILFRFSNYLFNRSLWTDEAWVALDIFTRTYKEIFLNDISHVSLPAIPPVGFLLREKLLVNILGNNEYVLRLFPFLCGVLGVVLYWILLKKWTGQIATVIALSFFVFAESLIHYSAECKQYSVEMFIGIVLYLVAIYFHAKPANLLRILIFTLVGMIAMFISHTAIFILGGIGIAQTIFLFKGNEDKRTIGYLLTYFLWVLGFVLIYFVYLREMVDPALPMGSYVINGSVIDFIPSGNIFSLGAMQWLWKISSDAFQNPFGLSPVLLSMGMCILGAIEVFKLDKKKFLMLFMPVVLTIIIAILRKFPFWGRFILFLTPAALFFIAYGISMVIRRGKIGLVLGIMIFCVLIEQPLKNAIFYEINPQGYEEMRPLMGVLFKDQFFGDSIFMNNSAQYAYGYYLKYFHYDHSPYKEGYFFDFTEHDRISLILNTNITDSQGRIYIKTHVYRKKGILKEGSFRFKKRTWLILTHLYDQETEQFIKDCFDDRGKMLLAFKSPGASLYLYVLNEPLAPIQEAIINYKLLSSK